MQDIEAVGWLAFRIGYVALVFCVVAVRRCVLRPRLRTLLMNLACLGIVVFPSLWFIERWNHPARRGVLRSGTGYGPGRAKNGHLSYGICTVTIPKDHRIGVLECPSVFRFWANPRTDVVLREVRELPKNFFFLNLHKAILTENEDRFREKLKALVFVHGFNTNFDEAARRTAQLAYDLKYKGAPIM